MDQSACRLAQNAPSRATVEDGTGPVLYQWAGQPKIGPLEVGVHEVAEPGFTAAASPRGLAGCLKSIHGKMHHKLMPNVLARPPPLCPFAPVPRTSPKIDGSMRRAKRLSEPRLRPSTICAPPS